MEQPPYRMGEHLMILYGRGHISLDEEGSLIRSFIELAHPKVRRRAFSFVGWSFRREDTIPDPILDRFTKIWDLYWEKRGKTDAQTGRRSVRTLVQLGKVSRRVVTRPIGVLRSRRAQRLMRTTSCSSGSLKSHP